MLIASGAFLTNDIKESLFLCEIGIGTIVVMVKLFYLLWQKEKIFEFLHDSIVNDSILQHSDNVEINKKKQNFMKFADVYLFMIAIAVILFIFSALPIFSIQKKLPLYITFSWNSKHDVIIYWMAYVFATWAILLSSASTVISVIIWYIMLNYSIKYQLLGNQFRNLGSIEATVQLRENPNGGKGNLFVQDLIGVVRTHQYLSEYKLLFGIF